MIVSFQCALSESLRASNESVALDSVKLSNQRLLLRSKSASEKFLDSARESGRQHKAQGEVLAKPWVKGPPER